MLREDDCGGGMGLFTAKDMPEGRLVGIYTGNFLTNAEYKTHINTHPNATRYALEVAGVKITIIPHIEKGASSPDHQLDTMSAINEPDSGESANCFAKTCNYATESGVSYYVCIYTCKKVDADQQLTWMYGYNFERKGYEQGDPCTCRTISRLEKQGVLDDPVPMLRASMSERPENTAFNKPK